MTVAVLSGKGGTGKTFVSVNLAAAAQNAAYLDCDVEDPTGGCSGSPTASPPRPSRCRCRYFRLKSVSDAANVWISAVLMRWYL